jgi:hypothetical protein
LWFFSKLLVLSEFALSPRVGCSFIFIFSYSLSSFSFPHLTGSVKDSLPGGLSA